MTVRPGLQHGPALLLSNCQRIARKALRIDTPKRRKRK